MARRRPLVKWAVAFVVAAAAICIGVVMHAVLGYSRTELVVCMEERVPALSALCRGVLLSPIRPTREEVDDVNRTAGSYPLIVGVEQGEAHRVLAHFIAAGVNINAGDLGNPPHFTALHHAAVGNDISAVRVLLANGADPTRQDANGRAPADLAREIQARRPAQDFSGVIALLDAAAAKR